MNIPNRSNDSQPSKVRPLIPYRVTEAQKHLPIADVAIRGRKALYKPKGAK